MAWKPACLTRGAISGRPAKATSCPRSVSARATPRLGGRLPPPDQFNQRNRAIVSSLDNRMDDPANDIFGGAPAEAEIPTKQFPGVDVGRDQQRIEEFGAFAFFER